MACAAVATTDAAGRKRERGRGAWHTNKVVLMPVQKRGRKVGGSLGCDSCAIYHAAALENTVGF